MQIGGGISVEMQVGKWAWSKSELVRVFGTPDQIKEGMHRADVTVFCQPPPSVKAPKVRLCVMANFKDLKKAQQCPPSEKLRPGPLWGRALANACFRLAQASSQKWASREAKRLEKLDELTQKRKQTYRERALGLCVGIPPFNFAQTLGGDIVPMFDPPSVMREDVLKLRAYIQPEAIVELVHKKARCLPRLRPRRQAGTCML